MVRNRKALLPKDHPDKGKRNGAGQQKALAKTAAAVKEVDSRWQAYNDTNLAARAAVRQKDAAESRAALSESAYKEVYTTATQSMPSALPGALPANDAVSTAMPSPSASQANSAAICSFSSVSLGASWRNAF